MVQASTDERDVHLLVIIHGLWGSALHVQSIVDSINTRFEQQSDSAHHQLKVLCPKTNESDFTYDGIDMCSLRALDEIDAYIESLAPLRVTRFSIVGYSLGGLIARYVLGALHSRTPNFFDSIRPINFTTFASPAIGIPKFPNFLSRFMNYFGARLLSRTGEQLYAEDDYLNGRPLLEIMTQPDTNFYKALARFENKDVYANSVNDRTVPYPTGAFPEDHRDEFGKADRLGRLLLEDDQVVENQAERGGLRFEFEEGCPHIIKRVYRGKLASDNNPVRPASTPAGGQDNHESATATDPLLGNKHHAQSQDPDGATTGKRRRWPRFRFLPSLPFFLRPRTFAGVPYKLGYLIPFLMPLLIPSFLVYLATRFMLQSRRSRRRIRDMLSTRDMSTLDRQLSRVGLALEDTFTELAEDVFPVDGDTSEHGPDGQAEGREEQEVTDPILSDAQKRMTKNLNSLPGLRKHLVYLPESRNSHGAIICRDIKWAGSEKGLEVLRWWSERFVF